MSPAAIQLVCPHDGAVNRVPAARLNEAPKCGRCHAPLFIAAPLELDAAGFERQLAQEQLPLLVDFWAPWCGPCRMMAPAFGQAAGLLEPHMRLARVNTEEQPELAARFGIRSIPTLILFAGGREIARHSGALPAPQQVVAWARERARAA
ncbi:MAG TPA: thioredoxin TrxC [Steroidobacteraceae bacterium]|nr:thioredoxin TrxC [Steroidobacteraceae bacterium]